MDENKIPIERTFPEGDRSIDFKHNSKSIPDPEKSAYLDNSNDHLMSLPTAPKPLYVFFLSLIFGIRILFHRARFLSSIALSEKIAVGLTIVILVALAIIIISVYFTGRQSGMFLIVCLHLPA
jgi:hypothetical protein